MIFKLVLLPQAEADIKEAFTYIAEHTPEGAAGWYRLVKKEIASLAEMPVRCPLAPEATKLGCEIRHLLYGRHHGIYRIVFRIVEETREVHILAVRHGARKPLSTEEVRPFLEI